MLPMALQMDSTLLESNIAASISKAIKMFVSLCPTNLPPGNFSKQLFIIIREGKGSYERLFTVAYSTEEERLGMALIPKQRETLS